MNKFYNKQTGVISHLCFYIVTPEKSRQKKLRLSGMICRFFDNCINECYIVGDGSPVPTHRLYRYTRRDLSSFSLPLRGRGTATRWKEFYATLSFRHFLAKMPPPPLLGDACKGASHACKSLPSRRRLQTLAHLQIPPATSSLSICGQKTSVIGLNRLYKKKTEMKNHLCFYYYQLSLYHEPFSGKTKSR